ncbi:mobilization protein [Streptomyces sp. IB2014 016-6]|uniref:relaxase/mobilization nuclease domain-containing protein n=1 Tax=Streptomyces sp. IB2014 016-6 TaxID=2517818 RepID=UPI0011CBF0F3|nr:mobilization protein [Streptomyces sp. IB2014 016-6]TXL87227.1 mobilization protein [Streptomyces sp. IB2014 016-6]
MIAKINSGKSTAGLIRYLFDTEKAKGHTDPHLVGSFDGFAPDPGRAKDSDAVRKLLVADLDLHVKQAGRLGRAPEKHVWHCSVRAAESDRILTDEEWANVARRVVHATGIAPEGDPDGCRWVAVRHAPDHIHIAATTVRADLRTARHWNDYLTADRELATVENHYGLHQVVRGDRTAAKRPTRAEQEKAKRAGHKTTPRERLRATARTAVAAAMSPEEFLTLLEHTDGVLVGVKRFPSGDVRGYTLALEGDTNSGAEPIWYSGSKLAPDLSWPRVSERLTGTTATARPWQDAITAIEDIPRALAHDGASAAQAHVAALGETLDVLPLLAPAPYREELRRAAAAFERASRSRVQAENHHAARLRGAVRAMLRTPPPNSPDGTLLALFLDTIVLATAATLRWHDLRHHDQQVTATSDALTHLHVAADQAAVTALATVKRAGPTSTVVRLRYEHTVYMVLPEHADTILNAPDWDALAATLARADTNGLNPVEVLRAAAQRPLDDARDPARLLTWRIQQTAHTAQTPRTTPPAPQPTPGPAPQPGGPRTRH